MGYEANSKHQREHQPGTKATAGWESRSAECSNPSTVSEPCWRGIGLFMDDALVEAQDDHGWSGLTALVRDFVCFFWVPSLEVNF